jgi:hypothetical protein
MWAALALSTVLTAPAQAGNLQIKNVRSTYGILGPTRKENKLLPGDLLVVAFDIEGLTVQEDGKVEYAMGMAVIRKGKAKPEFKREPVDMEAYNTLGGSTLPSFAMSVIGTQTPPGEYTLKVTVKDKSKKKGGTVTLEHKFEVVKLELGFVQVKLTTVTPDPIPVPALGVPGQSLLVHCAVVGYKTGGQNNNPNVTFEMTITDQADGKPTLPKPFKGPLTKEPKENPGMMTLAPIIIQMNRPGKFKVTLKATDNHAKKSVAEHSFELTVLDK